MVAHGVAHVGGLYPIAANFLTRGTTEAAALGFSAIKLYLAPTYATNYPNQTWGGSPATLTALAQEAAFVTAIGQFSTVVFNTWSFTNGTANFWTEDITSTQLANEYTEIYNLAVHLLSTYSNKTFIIQNWEGDWALLGSFSPTADIPSYRTERMAAFLNVKKRAIRAATAATSSTSKILFAVEVNRVLDDAVYRVHSHVVPQVRPDLVSLSLYEAINTWGAGQATAEANIDTLMRSVVRRVRHFYPNAPIYVGEYGWPEEEASFTGISLSVGGLIDKVAEVATELNVRYALYWNHYDNEELSPGNPRGYYIYKPNGALSGAGTHFATLL